MLGIALSWHAGIVGSRIDPSQPLAEAGLDSIGSVEFRNAASALIGRDLPATVAFDYPSIESMARFIVSQLASTSQLPTAAEGLTGVDSQVLGNIRQVTMLSGLPVP